MTVGPVFRPRTWAIQAKRLRQRAGYARWRAGAPSGPQVINAWSATFAQPSTFGLTPPALESSVIALNSSTSVGGGSGVPTQGNWLFAITGWNQNAVQAATHAVADDIHSFWRPGDVTANSYAVSSSAGATRVSVWYTPNLARTPMDVYIAPSGGVDGRACLVIEVSGLGPWDTVTGIATNYAAAATSVALSLGAPGARAFILGAVCGDDSTKSQAFAPGGWNTLKTVTASNGTDQTCTAVLTSAWIDTTSAVSASGTTSGASDLSGVLIGVQVAAASPIPAGGNPNWPYVKFEAAFGSGFQTAPDQMTWVDLTSRCWAWSESTGIQFELGQIQATELEVELDNFDLALASDYAGSPYYSNALNSNMSFQTGTSPWTGNDNATIAQSSTHVYASAAGVTAQYSMQVTPDGVTSFPGAVSEKVAVSASTQYTASAWFYSVAGYNGAQVAFAWYTSGNAFISFSTSSTANVAAATWTQATETATSPANAAFATIIVQFSGTPAAVPFWVAEAAFTAGASDVTTGRVTAGVPVRLRAAIGTLGGVVTNRWYVIQRNAQEWPQQITPADWRRIAPATGTDFWASTSAYGTTPYRGEVLQDSPYAWWPCDDQPLEGGVLPTSLRNAAPGNSNALTITLSPGGATSQLVYSTAGAAPVTNNTAAPPPTIAAYTVGQNAGWMFGDPQSSPFGTSASGGVVTAQPGSSAWTQSGVAGNTGSFAYFLSCNDASFPALANGVTVEGWFNFAFFGTSSGQTSSIYGGSGGDQSGQPVTALTIIELATATAGVCILQVSSAGVLNFITYNGSTPTTHAIYSSADMRTNDWHHFAITMTTSAWTVYIDGGQTATVSGTGAGMTSAWTYLLGAGDTGTAGGTGTGSIAHSGNVSLAHLAVYSAQLPAYRVTAHYWAAATAFGLLPAPQGVTATMINNQTGGQGNTWAPDGSVFQGTYTGTLSSTVATFSAIVTANAGNYSSGPSAWATSAIIGERIFAWTGWTTGLAPLFTVYTAASHGSETGASTTVGAGDSYTAGYGSGATGTGNCHVAGGSGASPPSSPTSTGDTVAQRLERVIGYAGAAGIGYGAVISPCRAIDPAALLVQAATDVGGQQAGQNLTNIAQSDGGLLFIDNAGSLTYWQKSHLASQYTSPVWTLTPDAPPTAGADPRAIPYLTDIKWSADPQRIWNSITITPFSPEGASLPLIIPSSTAAVIASQQQSGSQPLQITSYLQDQAEMATQANWLLTNFATAQIRVENLAVDAASNPALFTFLLGVNIGDVISAQNWAIGNTGITGTFRISSIRRDIHFAGEDGQVRATVQIQADYEPSSWWT